MSSAVSRNCQNYGHTWLPSSVQCRNKSSASSSATFSATSAYIQICGDSSINHSRLTTVTVSGKLASCLIYAWALPAHPTMHNCRSFGCVLLSNQIYLTTMYRSTIPLLFI